MNEHIWNMMSDADEGSQEELTGLSDGGGTE